MHFLKTILVLSFITASWASHAASPDTNEKPEKYCFNLQQQGLGIMTLGTLQLTANSMSDNFYTIFGTYLPNSIHKHIEPVIGSAVIAEDKDTIFVSLPIENGSLSLELSLKAGLEGSYETTYHLKTNKYLSNTDDPFDNLDSWNIADLPAVIRAVSVVQGGTVKRCEQD